MATLQGSRTLPRALRRARWQPSNITRRHAATAAAVEYHDPDSYIPDHLPPVPPPRPDRKQAVLDAKPFSDFLTDTFNRQHDYLRISVTERCNLRCLYCMPEEGVQLSPSKELLTTAEIYYLSALFVDQGVNKIRLTGGEPTVRKDIVPLMQQIGSLRRKGLKELALTTNGISLHRKLDAMVEAGLTGVNISLDTLDPFEFQLLTRRQGFDAVMKSINRIQEMNKLGAGIKLKINAVVMRGLNDHQIMPMVEKTRDEDIEVRFIEYMPFGGNKWSQKKMLPYSEMLDIIRQKYPDIGRMKDARNDTSKTWQIPGFKGRIGFITSMTHNFCGTCNRLRITSDGNLKVCLHGDAEVSLRDLLRKDHGGEPMDEEAFEAIRQLELDRRKPGSLRFDGEEGWIGKEQQLLEVIGAAVKRKKAKHAGMGELENMKNRPMILIDEPQRSARRQHPSLPARQRKILHSGAQPWSRIPLHLLNSSTVACSQVRHSSSNSGVSSQEQPQAYSIEPEASSRSEHDTGATASFGFQSLRDLFQQPERRSRYSRPRVSQERPPSSPLAAPSTSNVNTAEDKPSEVSRTFFRPSIQTSSALDVSQTVSQTNLPSTESHQDPRSTDIAAFTHETSPRVDKASDDADSAADGRRWQGRVRKLTQLKARIHFHGSPLTAREQIAHQAYELNKQPNASFPIRKEHQTHLPSAHATQAEQTKPQRPWGLNSEDMKTIDSFSDPQSGSNTNIVQSQQVVAATTTQPVPKEAAREKAKAAPKELTHLNASGEARMVDVGLKPDSRRVAIAIGFVWFQNHEPFQLIFENNNRKGDVLGVARVAGIMAAKRTSSLIPLCHPIAISRVEVDLKLEPPGVESRLFKRPDFGGVSIRALVECNGQTGVEMEALTAATTAALTVYDMCKAVDRDMIINGTRIAYKSGGKSGLHYYARWVSTMDPEFFSERDLAAPDINSLQERLISKVKAN